MSAKTVLCIRHGESTFNRAWRVTAVDPLHFDAPLSATGLEQVQQARAALTTVPVELVVTSPLTRALQTAVGLFADHPHAPAMLVAHLARERVENSCDVGRSPGELAAEFPTLDVAHLADVWWHAEGEPDVRGICVEPIEAVEARVAEFKDFLLTRPERVIAVVGHGTFFFHLTGKFLANCETTEWDLGANGDGMTPRAT
ncbi:MAG: histidine phosphatase family protein [Betaproteobacteria bacterium]